MSEIIDFIKENMQKILLIICIVIILLVLININNIDLNASKPKSKLVQQVTIETFSNELDFNLLSSPSDTFCESYLGNSEDLENACNKLTENNCANVKCCVFANRMCIAGDMNGPTYKTDKDGKLITIDSYYYLGKYIK